MTGWPKPVRSVARSIPATSRRNFLSIQIIWHGCYHRLFLRLRVQVLNRVVLYVKVIPFALYENPQPSELPGDAMSLAFDVKRAR